MGAYGTPEHLSPDTDKTNATQKRVCRKLNTVQKVGLWIYIIVIAFLGFCMLTTINSYNGDKVLGIILALTFVVFSSFFVKRFKKNKKSWQCLLCSAVAFVLYFSFCGTEANVKNKPQAKATIASSVSAQPKDKKSALSPTENISNYKNQCKLYKYKDVARNPNDYIGKTAKFIGNVEQIQESQGTNVLRVNVTKSEYGIWEDTIYVEYKPKSENESRILEKDTITLYGKLNGLKTYTAVLGNQISIPFIQAEYVEINE